MMLEKVLTCKLRLCLFLGASYPAIALAQGAPPPVLAAPVNALVDDHFVNLATLEVRAPIKSISIGDPSDGGLTFDRPYGIASTLDGLITSNGSIYTVSIDGVGEKFTRSGNTFTPVMANGSTLALVNLTFTYRRSDGTAAQFTAGYGQLFYPTNTTPPTTSGGITQLTLPNGSRRYYNWTTTQQQPPQPNAPMYQFQRLESIYTTSGYRAKFVYQEPPPGNLFTAGNLHYWGHRTKVIFLNDRLDSCPSTQNVCSVADRPYLSFAALPTGIPNPNPNTVDASGGTTTISQSSSSVVIQPPGAVPPLTYTLASGKVSAATVGGVPVSYALESGTGYTTTVRTTAAGTERYKFDASSLQLLEYRDALLNLTTYTYNGSGQLTAVTFPEGNQIQIVPDARGNALQTNVIAKPGSGAATITTSATYPATCPNALTCNQPINTTDGLNRVTAYEYEPNSGLIAKVTAPPPVANGIRPETRYSYTLVAGVYKLTGVSTCQTTASCSGTADEVKTTISYGTFGENNYQVKSATKGAGDGTLSATTAFTYNATGNVETIDGPLPGAADTARHRYILPLQRLIGSISPDPDGAGARKPMATRYNYDTAGRPTVTEVGTVNGMSDADWAAFVPIQESSRSYDGNGRVSKDTTTAGGSTYGVTQYGYDALGRPVCAVTRMDASQWNGETDPCLPQTTGPNGPDRVQRFEYDEVGRVKKVQSAYGVVGTEADEVRTTYTQNGKTATVTDAKGNVTAYAYDGHDRGWRTCYQTASSALCAGSPADYEQLGYDANGNITSRRLRDNQSIILWYDNLDRMTFKDVPNAVIHEYDITYTYDLLGRLTRATDSNTHFSAFGYDALGRRTSEQSNWTTRSSQFDAAGRRTRLTWGDGFYLNYDYDMVGNMTAIRENGAASGVGVLAAYGYDNLGRRTSLTRGNGTVTSYGYDPVSRLSALTQELAGTAQDLTLGFTYNPAGQIASSTRSNDAYAWGGHYNVDRPYLVNGLNQLTSAGATALSYDGRGNLTNSGGSVYGYTSENRLATAPGSYVMTYDPVGRYHWITNPGGSWMQYDGADLIEERNGNGVVRRYVHGPGSDEPLVWYEGASTADRRWLHADERGSIVAVTNGAGATLGLNRYDEYGIPASGNIGQFQYTGQAWLPELGMYNYKARIYSPTLGRFMQTDPIGYADGINWYNYVGSDPVNKVDPTGLCEGFGGNGGWTDSGGNPVDSGDCLITGNRGNGSAYFRWFQTALGYDYGNVFGSVFQGGGGTSGSAPEPQSGHNYDTTEQVCRVPLPQDQRSLINRATAVPDGTINGSRSSGTYPVGGWLFGVIPTFGGYVTTRFSDDGNIAVNTTTGVHLFVGTITRTIYSNGNGTFIRTVGSGNAGSGLIGRIRDGINDAAGPGIFRDANGLSRTVAKQLNPAC